MAGLVAGPDVLLLLLPSAGGLLLGGVAVTAGERLNTLAMNTPSGPGSLPRAAQEEAAAQAAAGHGPSETRLGRKGQMPPCLHLVFAGRTQV